MTVIELYAKMADAIVNGHGAYPVQIMHLDGGIPIAVDFECVEAQDYDGERYWLIEKKQHLPEWIDDGVRREHEQGAQASRSDGEAA